MWGLSAEEFGFVLVSFAFALTSYLGGKAGKVALARPAPPPAEGVMEVAGAIVSDKAVDRMVKSLDAFTSAATLMTHAIDKDVIAKTELTKALNRNSHVAEEMCDEIKDTGRHMERLKDELIRGQAR